MSIHVDSFLSVLPEEEQQRVLQAWPVVETPAGALLFQAGEYSDHFFIILSGQLEIVAALGTREETTWGLRGPGELIGEMGLLNQDRRRTASVRAKETSSLLKVNYSEFTDLITRYPSAAFQMARNLSSRMTGSQRETISILEDKNRRLQAAYDELKAAQAQIIEKEKMERELELARDIQRSILPVSFPELPGCDFGALMKPARAVGGDLYSIFALDPEHVALMVGDVTDKGVPAAIFMAQAHALMRATADLNYTPAQTLRRVNDHLLEMNDRGLFVTVLYGVLEIKSGVFEYARAGHEPPLLLVPGKEPQTILNGQGIPLGLFPEPLLEEGQINLSPGALLVMYTDGVTDSMNAAGETFDHARLEHTLARLMNETGHSAQGVCQGLFDAVLTYQQGAAQFDDFTVLILRWQG